MSLTHDLLRRRGVGRNHPTAVRGVRTVRGMDGHEWLASYQERLTEMSARVCRAQHELVDVKATTTSRDGAVTVTVDGAGTLHRLVLSERSEGMAREQLASAVLETVRLAQAEAAQRVAEAVAPLVGSPLPVTDKAR